MAVSFQAVTTQPEQLRAEIYTAVTRTSPEFIQNRFAIHRTNIANEYTIYFDKDPTEKESLTIVDIIAKHVPNPNFKYFTQPITVTQPTLVKVLEQENDPKVRIGGNFQMSTLNIDIPAGSPNDVTIEDFSFPIPISILAAQLLCAETIVGDIINVTLAPDTIIGTLTEDIEADEDTIKVSQTVIANTFVGAFLSITDGVNVDDLGRVINIGIDNGGEPLDNAIVVENATTNAYLASSPTYVQQTVKFVHNFTAPTAGRVEIGETKIGSSYIPANTILRLEYTNVTGTAKSFGIIIEYLY